jgi:adenylate cyclase
MGKPRAAPWPLAARDTALVQGQATIDRDGKRVVEEFARRMQIAGWATGAIGCSIGFATIGFLIPIFIDADDGERLGLLNAPLVALSIVIGGLAANAYMGRRRARALAWLEEGREPDAEEHQRTLRLPLESALCMLALWWIFLPFFVALNWVAHSAAFAAVVGGTMALGGEATAALLYLLSERIMRPVTARALAARLPERPVAPGVRGRLAIAWAFGTGAPLLGIAVVAIGGAVKGDVDAAYISGAVLFLGAVAYGVGLLATLTAARSIADPVTAVRDGLDRIEAGDLEARLEIDDGSEVGLLQAGFNRMADGLRERERIRDLFGRQVGRDVARAALAGGTRLGGEERHVGALFIDLVGSTSMALAMPPTEVVALLNRFFRVVVEVVEGEGGFVNKFEGDAALCVFGAPVACDDPAGEALRAARELDRRLREEVPELQFGIGVSAGTAIAGNVGAEQRFEYTVVGDPVNEAARLCELAKEGPGRVLASASARRSAAPEEARAWSDEETVTLRGRDRETGLSRPRAVA